MQKKLSLLSSKRIKVLQVFENIIFYTVIPITYLWNFTGLKILNPRYDDWLAEGDGTYEIAWEFFRNTPFPEWLVGRVDSYGLEMSRPSLYILPTLFSFSLRPFSWILGERFQFIGLMLLLNLVLHFYFSSLIFKLFSFTKIPIFLSSTLLLLSPILWVRIVEHTHYALTSNWIILAGFYLFLKRDLGRVKWFLLTLSSILIFPYYAVMIGAIFATFLVYYKYKKQITFFELLTLSFIFFSAGIVSGLISGYFFFSSDMTEDQYIFASNLNTLINASGWSQILHPRDELPLNYEGFAFLGSHILLISILVLIALFFRKIIKKKFTPNLSTYSILSIPTSILFGLSLGQEVFFDTKNIIEIPDLFLYDISNLYFRSPGRFTWPLVYFLSIFVIAKLFQLTSEKTFFFILVLSIGFGIYDMKPALSKNRDTRFDSLYESPLKSDFWKEISVCYDSIYSVPPVTSAHLLYPIAKVAYPQKLSIMPAAIPRVPPHEQDSRQQQYREDFKLGNFSDRAIYVFQKAYFVPDEITEENYRVAKGTMNETSRSGAIDGFNIIAPNFSNCKSLRARYGDKLKTGPSNEFLIADKEILLNSKENVKYLLSGWSDLETWGVWTSDYWSEILIRNNYRFDTIVLEGHGFELDDHNTPNMQIYLNNILIKDIDYVDPKTHKIVITIPRSERKSPTFLIQLRFENLKSPREVNGVNDDRLLGYALKKIQIL